MSDFEVPSSSQGSLKENGPIFFEDVPSSPVNGPASRKMKRPPTITPKRFTRFFAPRQPVQSKGKISRAGRQLRDITGTAVNQRRQEATKQQDVKISDKDVSIQVTPSRKRRKVLPSPDSSPLHPSPSKRVDAPLRPIPIFEDILAEDCDYSDHDELFKDAIIHPKSYPKPIRRIREDKTANRVLLRGFGGSSGVGRGRVRDHCSSKVFRILTLYVY